MIRTRHCFTAQIEKLRSDIAGQRKELAQLIRTSREEQRRLDREMASIAQEDKLLMNLASRHAWARADGAGRPRPKPVKPPRIKWTPETEALLDGDYPGGDEALAKYLKCSIDAIRHHRGLVLSRKSDPQPEVVAMPRQGLAEPRQAEPDAVWIPPPDHAEIIHDSSPIRQPTDLDRMKSR
jgi:hypothetical protein